MNAASRERVKLLLDRAAHLAPHERRAFVESAADGDRAVAEEALELLETLDDSGFLGAPTIASPAEAQRAAGLQEAPGARIGRYKLLQRIGEGGFGTVFMAEQTEPVVRRVALKIIKPGMDTRQVIARFEAERQALALMDHPNIARVLDVGATDAGRPYFVMELVHGEPVTRYCDRQQLSIEARLRLFCDICHAVQHAHQKGVIHRDIKPGNVLVTVADGRAIAKVIDFGIAKATAARLTEKTLLTEFNQLIGTPEYMSPEQAEPASADIDTRSDVYSLGVLLYELLTGTTPFDARKLLSSGFAGLIRVIREEQPQRPSLRLGAFASSALQAPREPQAPDATRQAALKDASAAVPALLVGAARPSSAIDIAQRRCADPLSLARTLRGDLDWIVLKCLEKDRGRRYDTAAALAEDVQRYLDRQPVLATPPSAGYRLRKFAQRNRGAVIAASLLGLTLLAGLAGTSSALVWALREQARATDEADRARQAADETKRVADFQAKMLAEIDIEAMGRGLKERFRAQVRGGLERQRVGQWPDSRKRTPEEVDASLATFDELSIAAHPADVAREVMDEFVLGRAAEALETQFAGQPLIQAQIHEAIGLTYRGLGMFDAAEPHLRAALTARRQELGPGHADMVASLNHLASLLKDMREYSEAEALYVEALAIPAEAAASKNNLALLLAERGDYAAAEPLLREALEMTRAARGAEHRNVASSLCNLALALQNKGDLTGATECANEALAMRRKCLGNEHREVADSVLQLAHLRRAQGDLSAAEPLYREAVAIRRKALGEQHPFVASALTSFSELLRARGKFAEAESTCREALALRGARLGDNHPDVTINLNNLALLLLERGDLATAESLHREVLQQLRGRLGDDDPLVATGVHNLGACLVEARKDAEAERVLREALDLRRRLLGPEHTDVAQTLNSLGWLLKNRGDCAAAEPLLREALAVRRKLLGEHPDVASVLNNLALLSETKDDPAAAEVFYAEALAIYRSTLGEDHPRLANCMHNLATLLRNKGANAEAEPLFREALAIRERRLPAGHIFTTATRGGLAFTLVNLARDAAAPSEERAGRLTEAEALLLSAWQSAADNGGPSASLRQRLLVGLCDLYDVGAALDPEHGYDAKAAEWRAKLEEWKSATQPTSAAATP